MDIVLKIEGMHCEGCSSAVERALRAAGPTDTVTVDRAAGRAVVALGNASADPAPFVAAVWEAGYDAALVK